MNGIVDIMLLLISLLLISFLLDVLAYLSITSSGLARKTVSVASMVLYGAVSIVLIKKLGGFSLGVIILFAYRGFNMARVIKDRMHQQYLRSLVFRTSASISMLQLLLLTAGYYMHRHTPWHILLTGSLILEVTVALIFLMTTLGHAKRMRQAAALELVAAADLPSITIAIPARNETQDLYECIQSLLASQYPKLEILVLDDCSQTRRTPEIIRSFAHDGVRFVNGEEPNDSWLAKNQAYERLSRFANGEYIIFAGVDIRFDPSALRKIVSYALMRNKEMVCVMPQNQLHAGQIPLIQPMRYVWELILPRKLVNKPPVLSSCWMIRKSALAHAGGFKAAARMVVPEAHFARELAKTNQYGFVAGGTTFGVSSEKSLSEQRDTAIRVGYPSLHRRPESVALVTFCYIVWILIPVLAAFSSVDQTAIVPLACVAAIIFLHSWLYAIIFLLAYNRVPIVPVACLPVAALVYVGLMNYSMYKYEFSEVTWKGRNVCLPVMRVVQHLPDV